MEIYNSYLEVDLSEIGRNVEKIRRGIGPDVDIIAVLKGNAYGMGHVPVGKYLAKNRGIETFGCSSVFEAVALKKAGVGKLILVMGGVPYHNIPAVVEYDLHTPAYHEEYLELLDREAGKTGKTASVHIKIETGLNRIGVKPGPDLEKLCIYLKALKHVKVCGIYTHFTQSGIPDKSVTYEQMSKFKEALRQAEAHNFALDYVHVSNSGAVTWFFEDCITHIRPGAMLYGFDNNVDEKVYSKNLFNLCEVLSWRAFVTNVKTVPAGETVGYDGAYKITKPTLVATASIGYGDGYTRKLAASGKADMLINGKRAAVIAICMDQTFLDVTGLDVKINDEVTILGKNGSEFISVFELQRLMKNTYLDVISVIPPRVVRTYKN